MKDEKCPYCVEGKLVDEFAIKVLELPASKVYLFREQSHRGRIIVASKSHASELIDLDRRERQAFMDDVATVASAMRRAFGPDKINYAAYGDKGHHLHFHLVPKYASDPFEWGGTFEMNPQRIFLTERECADLVEKLTAELYAAGGIDFRKTLSDMRRDIGADGVVDLCESAVLLASVLPLAGSSATIDAFIAELKAVREDGKVTAAESDRILALLDQLLA